MAVKPIRDAASYDAAVERLEKLANAKAGTAAGDEADVLSTLIELYEKQNEDVGKPTALEAIKFRMDQLELKPRDLVPDIGSRSRVSEVLSGQRPLTVDMIKSLHERWRIPLTALINTESFERMAKPEPSRPVLKRLQSLNLMAPNEGYFAFRNRICGSEVAAAYRRRTTPTADHIALDAWCVAAMARSLQQCQQFKPARKKTLDRPFLRSIARCSTRSNGAIVARELLAEAGVCFVVLRHFPGTHLDGAALIRHQDNVPVIAMTLRHDRVDNFWFTLLHECAHIALGHVSKDDPILDDLEISPSAEIEMEADRAAREALVPSDLWEQLDANEFTSTAQIVDIAHEAGVHPAVVAGMWRRDQNNYRKFSALLGHGTMRPLFEPDEK